MQPNEISQSYKTYYVDVGLERASLFKLLQKTFALRDVLYPGCLMHITPSFYFPHVAYVDIHENARLFFSDLSAVKSFIDRKKLYQRSTYIEFIEQDFNEALPLRIESYDLLISLYAGGIAHACHSYLKPGGILLSDDHHDDAGQAKRESGLELIAVIKKKGKDYLLDRQDLDNYFVTRNSTGKKSRQTSSKKMPEKYTNCADYYLFRKAKRF